MLEFAYDGMPWIGSLHSCQEWEALCIRLCVILGVRNLIEQPVGSRFFRHPDVQAQSYCFNQWLCIVDISVLSGCGALPSFATCGCAHGCLCGHIPATCLEGMKQKLHVDTD